MLSVNFCRKFELSDFVRQCTNAADGRFLLGICNSVYICLMLWSKVNSRVFFIGTQCKLHKLLEIRHINTELYAVPTQKILWYTIVKNTIVFWGSIFTMVFLLWYFYYGILQYYGKYTAPKYYGIFTIVYYGTFTIVYLSQCTMVYYTIYYTVQSSALSIAFTESLYTGNAVFLSICP